MNRYLRRVSKARIIGMLSGFSLVVLAFLTIFPIVRHEEFAEAAYTPSTSTLAIVSSKDTASVDVTPTSSTGTFVTSDASDQAEFTVTTNNLTGYSLNILGTDVSGQLVNTNTGDILDTISSDTSESDFRNGSASLYSNKWGYRLNINNTTTTDFIAAPTTATSKTIYTTSSPNTTSDNYKLGIGARVDYTKPSGTYTNTFVLTAVGNPMSYQINYLDGSTGTGTPALPTEAGSNITASAFILSTSTPTRSGYDFVSWCDGTVDYTVSPNSCTGTTYNPGDNYTFSSMPTTGTTTANLYAMWELKAPFLYDVIADMSKGTQTAAQLQAAITIPTSADRTQDTSNSGVYEYNASEFGTATDAANTHKIYYYRGVLENSVGTYGSDGSAVTYPNYVKLGNTCWRILRTTGSGGVKMIYNGAWTGTTCANSITNAQLGAHSFSVDYSSKHNGSAFGYTQNGSYNASNLSATYSTMFGSNTNFSANSTDSGAKTYIENWYNDTSGIKATYGSHLEANAGYCNDRTLNSSTSWTTPMADSATVATSTVYYTGAYIRNLTTTKPPSLTCPRNNADVYTTSAATTGNKQLSQPIALITADEASFAGSGASNGAEGSSYHANSFLRSGSGFWLLSPYQRYSSGYAYAFYLYSSGYLLGGDVGYTSGIRPAISLSQGATITSGTGIATDPWEVTWNFVAYQINYLDGSTGTDTPALPAETGSNITASLSTSTPTKSGYGFVGWCDGTVNYATDPNSCTGTTYNLGDSYTFSSIPSTGIATANLYAMWKLTPFLLYDVIADMSKGTQTAAELQAAITVPTSADRTQDTSNSGVYEYDASVFGTATDASNDYKIYYYRGVLQDSLDPRAYGSDGSSITYPNYVKLGNTCWRILRTTGSGGVKMIYNGNWTGSTCANSLYDTQISLNSPFSSVDSNQRYGPAFGYTYNSSYTGSALSATYSAMFGSNTSFSANSTDSNAKTVIENWYDNTSGIKAIYGYHLEADAGYCADRTLNETTSWTTPIADNATMDPTITYYTGAYIRNQTTTKNPSLTCPRNNADVYTTSTATTGNKQLTEPIALITADEASFAGSGTYGGIQGSAYHTNSFLRSGATFWLLSPNNRYSNGYAVIFRLASAGTLDYAVAAADGSGGIRPAISLSQGAKISSGTGIATDPWEVIW